MNLSENIWSIHPRPGLYPACSLRSMTSTAMDILMMVIVGLYLTKDGKNSPIIAVTQVDFLWYCNDDSMIRLIWYVFSFQDFIKKNCGKSVAVRKLPVLNNSAFKLSCPEAFPFFRDYLAETISRLCGSWWCSGQLLDHWHKVHELVMACSVFPQNDLFIVLPTLLTIATFLFCPWQVDLEMVYSCHSLPLLCCKGFFALLIWLPLLLLLLIHLCLLSYLCVKPSFHSVFYCMPFDESL